MENFKAGYVSIIGLPNSGKSTLLNALLGQKISIATNKPQTTRKRILGILTTESYQIVFLDTPGVLKPQYLLQEKMMEQVTHSVNDADVIICMVDLENDPTGERFMAEEYLQFVTKKVNTPKYLVLNKIDKSTQEKVTELAGKFDALKVFERVIPMAASLGANVAEVLGVILDKLPEGDKFFPDDRVADANERFFVSEIIREKIFEQYREELPYSCDVLIADFQENENRKDLILAEIIVEKESQKGIIIGSQGAAIKKLGQSARTDIEALLDRPVYLELRVKVREKWRSSERMLKSLGYTRED
ncbi:MAG: GTPase Era [Methanococcaceae archaeon]